jgi:hypothetical protein
MHPISFQDAPFNYRADGRYSQVFETGQNTSAQNGYLVLGNGILSHPSSNSPGNRPFLGKLDSQGNFMWSNRYDSSADSLYQGFGGLYFTSYSRNNSNNLALVRSASNISSVNSITTLQYLEVNDFGQILDSSSVLSFDKYVSIQGMVQDIYDSCYIAFGSYYDTLINKPWPFDGFLLKFRRSGEIVWQNRIPSLLFVSSVKQIGQEKFILSATPNMTTNLYCSDSWNYNSDYEILMYDANLGVQDYYRFGGYCTDSATLLHDSDSTGIVLGLITIPSTSDSCAIGAGNFFTQRVSWSGNSIIDEDRHMLSFQCLNTYVNTGVVGFNNETAMAGNTRTYNEPYSFGFIYKFNQSLQPEWLRYYSYYSSGVQVQHSIAKIIQVRDSGYVCVGSVKQDLSGPNPLLESPWIFKVDSYGCLEPGCQYVGVSEMVIGLQDAMRVYPNPVADLLTVGFSLPAGFSLDEDTQLVLTDMQGRTLLSENIQRRGWENFRHIINVQDLAAGTYVLHWKSDTKWLDSATVVKN